MRLITPRIFLFSVLLFPFFAFAQGIQFVEDASWSSVLAKAKKNKQLVFLDAYTTWCGPCKKMTKEVFPVKEVGSYFNANFVSVKMDMEKGEGIALAEKYEVTAYPTLLFVDGDGTVQHRFTGYASGEELIEIGQTALDPARRLGTLEARFATGDRDPAFLKTYTQARYDLYDNSHLPIAETLFATFDNPTAKENLEFVYRYLTSANTPLFQFMLDHQAAFEDRFGKRAMRAKIEELIPTLLEDPSNDQALTQIESLLKQLSPNGYERQLDQYRLDYHAGRGEIDKMTEVGKRVFKDWKNASPDDLNNVAWSIYLAENVSSSTLKQATKWAKKSIKLSPNSSNWDTLAHLYAKAGKTKKAIKTAEKALTLGKENGDDVSGTEALLESLK